MARTKARVAAAHAERQRAPGEALVRKRAAIAKAARVMSVQEVEIATLEREVMHTTRAPFRTNATLERAKLTVLLGGDPCFVPKEGIFFPFIFCIFL